MSHPSLHAVTIEPKSNEQSASILSSLEAEKLLRPIEIKSILFCILLGLLGLALYWATSVSQLRKSAQLTAVIAAPILEKKSSLSTVPEQQMTIPIEEAKAPTVVMTEPAPLAEERQSPIEKNVSEVRHAARPENRPVTQTVVDVKNSKDKDVALIEALPVRTSRLTKESAKEKKEALTKSQGAEAKPIGKTASAKTERHSDPSRDIVARTDNESTEALVKRCASLGFFEGELCRLRICSGRWGTDPGCPAPATQPSTVN